MNAIIYKGKINFEATKKGTWYVVLDNIGKTTKKVEVQLHHTKK